MRLIFGLCLISLIALQVQARIINVPEEQQTILEAIRVAENRDTILVHPGIYNENIHFWGKELIIGSLYLTTEDTTFIDSTIIDGNSNNSVVRIHNIEGPNVALIGFTIRNGEADYGAGISCEFSRPVIHRCKIIENEGGGIYCENSIVIITNCIILNNSSSHNGGGIFSNGDRIIIRNSTINENSITGLAGGGICIDNTDSSLIISCLISGNSVGRGRMGSGIYVTDSNLTLEGCIIRDNQDGSGISCREADLDIIDCTIRDNTSTETSLGGGGIYILSSRLNIVGCRIFANTAFMGGGISCRTGRDIIIRENYIYQNSAETQGGGIYCIGSPSLIFIECCIFMNSAEDIGGGVFSETSQPTFTNCTISENSSDYGGGIYCQSSSEPFLSNTILWNNSPQEIYFSWRSSPCNISIEYSDIENGENGIEVNDNGEVDWGEGNIDANPLFVDAENGDFNLTADSPCIDVGDPGSPPDPDGTRADMGAFYFNQAGVGWHDRTSFPVSHIILNAFPNPFNSSTTITYDLPIHSPVSVRVFDMSGSEVAMFVYGEQTPGYHQLTWTAENHPAGLYFCRLDAGEYSKTTKIALVR